MSPPLAVSPEAGFIAASAASQIVTNDHDGHSETWYDQVGIEPSGETALVSTGALQLANNFVDQLLFNIIGVAGSTSLAALRPAVSEVLKTKLAKDAINQADEELREYIGGGEVEDLVLSPTEDRSDDWDLELVWKRTRLRCMVYSSLGDLEEEDEDYFMDQEHLNDDVNEHSDSTVSPAVAIFLTSILEYMGEHVLVIAGQAAFNRMRVRYEKELRDGLRLAGEVSERIVVEDLDMERVALDRTLGRLWRSWKKRIRSPTEPNFARPFPRSANYGRHDSTTTDAIHSLATPQEDKAPNDGEENGQPKLELSPSGIPLPMGDNDIAEIEVPGLVSYSDDEDSDVGVDEILNRTARPKSLVIHSSVSREPSPASASSQLQRPVQAIRRRASSLPTSSPPPYTSTIISGPNEQSAHGEVEAHTNKVSDDAVDEATLALDTATERNVNEDGVSSLGTDSSDYVEDKSAGQMASPISMIVSGAAAFGAAAVAGVTAIAHGTAPQTLPTPMEDGEVDDFTEEPKIMTSSRVSFGGRSSPSTSESERHRPPSMLLVRSNSVRSARMIDVQGPRTPSIQSRSGSFDIPDLPSTRPASISREGSISTPPIAEEGMGSDNPPTKAIKRNAVIVPSSMPSSEEYRDVRSLRDPISSNVYPAKPVAPKSTPVSTMRVAPTSAPASSDKSTRNKILNPSNSAANRSFLDLDTKPDVPEKMYTQRQPSPLPTVPEKSANRTSVHGSTRRRSSADHARGPSESPKATRAKLNDSPSSSSSNKYKPMRSSEDGNPHRAQQDVARDFEELLQNDQTIQYTLTPENMRDIEAVSKPNNYQLQVGILYL